MRIVSIIALPLFVFFIVLYAFFKKQDVYSSFLEGAKEGLTIVLNITPAIIAMVFAVNIFFDSNVINFLLGPLIKTFNLIPEIIPMAFLRPISGTATLSIMTNIFKIYGPDSFAGRLASILQGCTDTTIYVIALYYSSVKITKTRYTVLVGLAADLVGIIMAFLLTNIFF